MIHIGDCLEVMRGMADNSVDAIVTDPPYGLEFMGKAWDAPWKGDTRQRGDGNFAPGDRRHGLVRHGMGASYGGNTLLNMQAFQDWCEAWASECLRVLKPGGYMLAFSGSRTYHRTAAGIENAGFEIRDQIMWVYGSGFPKSHNGPWGGTALKPAHEPVVMARKPLAGTVEANWREHGTGALNIDACRVDAAGEVNPTIERRQGSTAHLSTRTAAAAEADGKIESRTSPERYQQHRPAEALGRWPANLIHDGSAEVLAEFPNALGQQRDTGPLFARTAQVYGEFASVSEHRARGDSGSAARFFYCAKASREDRNDGLDSGPVPAVSAGATMRDRETADWSERNGNHHPTVKPTNLMRYLCRLVTPAGGLVLDPFAGSGSTGRAAIAEGFLFVGIEIDPEYAAIAEARCRAVQPGLSFGDVA